MILQDMNILLADDDRDDCFLFGEALQELGKVGSLSFVNDGESLMKYLEENKKLPDVLFLDLNMPRKNGIECLLEIRKNEKMLRLPVIVISTSYDKDMVNMLYKEGAQYYICKPNQFEKLKNVIDKALQSIVPGEFVKVEKEKFILES